MTFHLMIFSLSLINLLHHIRTKLFSIPLASLQRLYNICLNTYNFDTSSLECTLNSIANCRMFKPVNSDIPNESTRKFLNMKFANKGIDAINIGNILNHRDVVKNIPYIPLLPSWIC